MRLTNLASFGVAIFVWACADSGTAPAPHGLLHGAADLVPATGLNVTVSINDEGGQEYGVIDSAGTYTLTAHVSGGSPPYVYHWAYKHCTVDQNPPRNYCDPNWIPRGDSTSGMLTYRWYPQYWKTSFAVTVREVNGGLTGTDTVGYEGPGSPYGR